MVEDYIASQDCAEHMATVGITSFYAAPIQGVIFSSSVPGR